MPVALLARYFCHVPDRVDGPARRERADGEATGVGTRANLPDSLQDPGRVLFRTRNGPHCALSATTWERPLSRPLAGAEASGWSKPVRLPLHPVASWAAGEPKARQQSPAVGPRQAVRGQDAFRGVTLTSGNSRGRTSQRAKLFRSSPLGRRPSTQGYARLQGDWSEAPGPRSQVASPSVPSLPSFARGSGEGGKVSDARTAG